MKRDDLYEVKEAGLTPTGMLQPQPWMTAPETAAVFEALEAGDAEARFVGGCVRDGIAKRPVTDVDIATTSLPEQTVKLLEAAGIKAIPTGIEHGTITAIVGDKSFEITTLRVDVNTDGRHAEVGYTTNWIKDAQRRDFTFNALSATREGDVYDPFNGIADLSHGRVCFIGRPADRIAEDYLRILRYFRFHASHGRPPADRDALQACRNNVERLAELSGERIRDEVMKILSAPNPASTLLLMRGEKVLDQILPEAGEVGRLRTLTWLTTRAVSMDSVINDPLRNLAGVIPPENGQEAAQNIAHRWRLSNHDAVRLGDMLVPLGLEPDAPESDFRQLLYRIDAETFRDRVLLAWADDVAIEARLPRARTDAWIRLLEMADAWQKPVLPLSGEDVMALGVSSGPKVGKLLRSVEAWWIDQGFPDDRERCLGRLREITAEMH